MSIVLVREDEGIQRPIYYFSQTLYNVETRYLKVKKLAFTLVNTSKKLKPYFQAHQVIVLTDQVMRLILYKLKISGHLVRWAIELGEFRLQYKPKLVIKG
jgi:hypothetical protein